MARHFRLVSLSGAVLLGMSPLTLRAQQVVPAHQPPAPPPVHVIEETVVIVPQVRPRPHHDQRPLVHLSAVTASITIDEQVSSTTVELVLTNPAGVPQQAELLLPVPEGVSVRSLEYDGAGPEPTARLLARDEARRIYDSIVYRQRDPALLEFAGFNLIRTSVFPVPPGGTQRLRLTYEQLLPADGNRVDYVLPRSDSLEPSGVTWTISATIKSKSPISTVYSPSHDLATERVGPGHVIVKVPAVSAANPGSFRLSYLSEKSAPDGIAATFMAYPDPALAAGSGAAGAESGYFLLLAGLPARLPEDVAKVKREVVLVIDRSGSMRGQKIEQARAAAVQVVDGLEMGEAFNIIDYSDSIASFAEHPVVKSAETAESARRYIRALQANGGTNLHDAILEALRPEPTAGMLPMVLFLTDGLPTVGERSEVKIRDDVKAANKHARRIFTFGVGFDVNTPLLAGLARASRAASTFVLPEEDVEVKVSQVFRRLSGPILASPTITVLDAAGKATTRPVRQMLPGELPDLFDGDQLVLLGQYMCDAPVRFRLEGSYLGKARSFEFAFDPKSATTRNGYVPRLWATRKIAVLIDQIRQAGAEGGAAVRPGQTPSDPRMKELVDEIVRLSVQYGILTDYTAFLATEPGEGGRAPSPIAAAPGEASAQLSSKAAAKRSGKDSVNQELNLNSQSEQKVANARNLYLNEDLKEVTSTTCQQVNDRTMFKRSNRWVDARLLDRETEQPDRVVEFGTPEFSTLLDQLIKENRQGMLAVGGDILLAVNNQRVLVKCP